MKGIIANAAVTQMPVGTHRDFDACQRCEAAPTVAVSVVDVSTSARRLLAKSADALAALVLIGLIFAFQYASGAYQKDFSADEDEPAHVVSSLMVRDYIAQGFPGSPLHFAESYYVHYPKVAIGHWPPLFHTAEGVWMLVFGRTRPSMLALTAIVAALLAISVFAWIRIECGLLYAFVSTALLVITPIYRAAVFTVEPQMLLTFFAFWAAILYGSCLENHRRLYAWLFAVVAICAMLVHGRGAMLLFVPPAAGLLVGNAATKKRWLVLLLVVCSITLTLPQLLGQADPSSPVTVARNAWMFFYRLGVSVSWPVLVIAIFGAVQVFRSRRKHLRWIAMLALILGGCCFHVLVNVPLLDGYLLPMAPALAVLFAAGLQFFVELFGRSTAKGRVIQLACAALTFAIVVQAALIKTAKPDTGCHLLINELQSSSPSDIYLVAGDAVHEGALIAEVALADPQPQRFVLRASKVLSASSWAGRGYRLRFTTPDEVRKYLDDSHVGLIFAQQRSTPAHMLLLTRAVREEPQMWTQLLISRPSGGFQVFRRAGPMPQGTPVIRIDMRDKLGRFLENR